MGDALAASTGRSGGARGRFPGAARAQAAPLHEPERRQAPPFGGMSGGRAFQIGPAHEGGGPPAIVPTFALWHRAEREPFGPNCDRAAAGRACHPKGRSAAEDGAAVDAPGLRRLSGLFSGLGDIQQERRSLYLVRRYLFTTCTL